MTLSKLSVLLCAGTAVLSVGACNKAQEMSANAANKSETSETANRAAASKDPVASAESAAPAAIAHNASVVTVGANGAMTEVRKGTNGWNCIRDAPDTPGPDPMCFDANAGKWVDAWVHHKPPPAGAVGVMY